ncbi:MAG: hypothetical protein J4478_02935 [Candidatus Diapherotrites archaeon]|uniref:Uncharacterized protein n=1 Tax=Candidatus Iainarchaeum sp. TaxID=3101447 RepID=A0A8T4KXJ5_9ARCH|nr:hypothetical protein [Candidatus Diapherotrites archaeon]
MLERLVLMALRDFAGENKIRLLGFPSLDEVDDAIAEKTVRENFEKISKWMPEFEATLQAKQFNKAGARRQHELHARLFAPRKKIFATATEWNFLTALQECLKELRNEAKKSIGKK